MPNAVQGVDGVNDVRGFHLAGEVIEGPERLVVPRAVQGIEDVTLSFVLDVGLSSARFLYAVCRSGVRKRPDFLECGAESVPCDLNVIAVLEVQPEALAGPEVPREP